MSVISEFKEFAFKGSVVDLAVGVIIGGAFGGVVKSIVDDLIMPPIGVVSGNVDFSSKFILLKAGAKAPPPYATMADAKAAGAVLLSYGNFIGTFINFLLVAFAVFLLVRVVNRFRKTAAAPVTDVDVLKEIRDLLKTRIPESKDAATTAPAAAVVKKDESPAKA